jgi:hypothetical protein
MKEGVLIMSRTDKDKPYEVISRDAKKFRADATHDHTKFGRTRTVRNKVKDADGKIVMETLTVIKAYFGSWKALKVTELAAKGLLAPEDGTLSAWRINMHHTVNAKIAPSTHGKPFWFQSTSGNLEEIATILADYRNVRGYVRFYGYDTALFVREEITRPVEEIVEEPYYAYDECTIDVVPDASNKWGWELPCHYSPDVYRSGWNGNYQRARKLREARRNRRLPRAEAHAIKRELNHPGYIDIESDAFEDLYITDYVSRRRWDWD